MEIQGTLTTYLNQKRLKVKSINIGYDLEDASFLSKNSSEYPNSRDFIFRYVVDRLIPNHWNLQITESALCNFNEVHNMITY